MSNISDRLADAAEEADKILNGLKDKKREVFYFTRAKNHLCCTGLALIVMWLLTELYDIKKIVGTPTFKFAFLPLSSLQQ